MYRAVSNGTGAALDGSALIAGWASAASYVIGIAGAG